jgi:hypothetical protein
MNECGVNRKYKCAKARAEILSRVVAFTLGTSAILRKIECCKEIEDQNFEIDLHIDYCRKFIMTHLCLKTLGLKTSFKHFAIALHG